MSSGYSVRGARTRVRYPAIVPNRASGWTPSGEDARAVEPFAAFIARVNPRFVFYPHCVALIEVLQQVADGIRTRVIVAMPPRHGKSELISRMFPAYILSRDPTRMVGLASYTADLAYGMSRSARDAYTESGGTLRGDASAVRHWLTSRNGGMWATGVGGPITGKGFHIGIIDDPIKNAEEAASSALREKQIAWYDSTWGTRAEPHAAMLIVMTRWHERDLVGMLLAREDDAPEAWHVVRMPALAEEDAPDLPATCTVAPDTRALDAPLCPERYTAEHLARMQQRIGSYFFSALFQQRPTVRGGTMIQRQWFTALPVAPLAITNRVRYWDIAGAKPGAGDYTVGVLMALLPNGGFLVEDVERFQLPGYERNARIRQTAERDSRLGGVRTVIEEPPGLGKEPIRALVLSLAGYSVSTDAVHRDKISRAQPFCDQAQAGNVSLLPGAWHRAWLEELEAFPTGAHDDQMDAASGAFNALATTAVGFAYGYDTSHIAAAHRRYA